MTVSTLAIRAIRGTVVALIAGILSMLAAVLGAGSASATTHHPHPAVSVRAGTQSQTYSCPQTTSFSARVLSNGPALVRYHWLRSDGWTSTTRTLHFRGRGHHSFTAHTDWTIGNDVDGWEQLVVTSPDRVSTRLMTFITDCATIIWTPRATATDSSALCDDVYTDLGGEIDVWGTVPSGVRYYWMVDGAVVGDTTVTDPATLATGELHPTFHYAFIPPHGTTYHSVVLHAATTDGSSSWDSGFASFTTTCA